MSWFYSGGRRYNSDDNNLSPTLIELRDKIRDRFKHLKDALNDKKYVYWKSGDPKLPLHPVSDIYISDRIESGRSYYAILVKFKNNKVYTNTVYGRYNKYSDTIVDVDFVNDFEIRDKQVRKKAIRKPKLDMSMSEYHINQLKMYDESPHHVICYFDINWFEDDGNGGLKMTSALQNSLDQMSLDRIFYRYSVSGLKFRENSKGDVVGISGLGPMGGTRSVSKLRFDLNFKIYVVKNVNLSMEENPKDKFQLF